MSTDQSEAVIFKSRDQTKNNFRLTDLNHTFSRFAVSCQPKARLNVNMNLIIMIH